MRIIVVGVGALGSHVVPLIRNICSDMTVVDFDRVEAKNTLSQNHPRSSIGKLKVDSIAGTMLLLHKVKIDKIANKIVVNNVDSILSAASSNDLIIDCLDNGESRRLVQNWSREHNVPLLHGALAADGAFGRVIWDHDFVIDEAMPGVATCEDGDHLAFIATVSAYIASAARTFVVSGKRHGFAISPVGSILIS